MLQHPSLTDPDRQEARECKLDLSSHEEGDVNRLVEFMYKLRYYHDNDAPSNEEAVQIDLTMFIIADKYNISSLQDLSTDEFMDSVQHWSLDTIKNAQEKVAEIISTAYDSSASKLCDILVARMVELDVYKHHRDVPKMLELNLTVPEYGIDLIKALGENKAQHGVSEDGFRTYSCQGCGAEFGTAEINKLTTFDSYECPLCGRRYGAMVWRRRAHHGSS